MLEMTQKAKDLLNETLKDAASPFSTQDNQTYLSYDKISIQNALDLPGGVEVIFLWKGKEVSLMRLEGVSIKDNDSIHLHGIEGRMAVQLV